MQEKKITGTVQYQDLGVGFWGVVDTAGNQWLTVNLPEHLKKEGKTVNLTISPIEDSMNMFMWGTPVQVISF